jgi:hypothetical protein
MHFGIFFSLFATPMAKKNVQGDKRERKGKEEERSP